MLGVSFFILKKLRFRLSQRNVIVVAQSVLHFKLC